MLSSLLGFTLCLNTIYVLLICEIFQRTYKRMYIHEIYVEMHLNKLFVNICTFYMGKIDE